MKKLIIADKNYSSWSLRPWILLKALGIPFQEEVLHYSTDLHLFPVKSPTGKVPCLFEEDFCIWDTISIVEYLAESNPAVWPLDKHARAWARSASAEMHSGFATLRDMCGMNCAVRAQLFEHPPALAADIARIEDLFAEGLRLFEGPWLAGPTYTAVDAFFAPVVFRFQTYGIPVRSTTETYMNRALAHPAMQEWLKGALSSPRYESYEKDLQRRAQILSDFRVKSQ